ncbi:MAG: hypothetical protein ACRC8S_16570 [Fimbriiglobus sp.]
MKFLGLIVGTVLIALGAFVHGSTTHRWSVFSATGPSMDKLHAHTVTFGDYEVEVIPTDVPLKEKSIATTKRYFSSTRNQTVVVSVITGPAGSVSTHTPDVCYVASGYKMLRTPVRQTMTIPGLGEVSYYVSEFEKKSNTKTERQRVRWAWSVNGPMQAPDNPRFSYLRVANLAKFYIVTSIPENETALSGEDSQAVKQFSSAVFAQFAQQLTSP